MLRLLAVLLPSAGLAQAEPFRAAVFDFEFLDTSQEGEAFGRRADEAARVRAASEQLRGLLAERGIAPVDLAPAKARIDKAAPLTRCNGCEADIARELGADLAVTGVIQKVSNLILNFNVAILDARTGAPLRAASVDIRGNTDESWRRGVSYLVRNRLLDPPLRATAP
jgi:hypothetical protein